MKHDKDWRGLAHTPVHHESRLSDSVENGKALCTLPLPPHASSFTVCHASLAQAGPRPRPRARQLCARGESEVMIGRHKPAILMNEVEK